MSAVWAADAVPLLPLCAVCGANLVPDLREPCGPCLAAFGPMLRRGERQVSEEEFAAARAAGDREVARVLAERRQMIPLPDPSRGGLT
jgi:hypothetical protein